MIFALLVIPGLVCAYALLLRPALHKIPALKAFYDDADGFWAKVWALCGNSITMLWGHLFAVGGVVLSGLDYIAPLVGDPDLKSQVSDALQGHPQWLAYASMAIGALTIIIKARSIGKSV